MALPTFGAAGAGSGGGTTTTCNIPVPTGVVTGSIVLAFLYVETTQAVTPPTGAGTWAEAPDSPVVVTGAHAHDMHIYWKRATGADSGNYAFVIAAGLAWRMGVALRFAGCVDSGNPFDVTNSAIKTTTTTGATPAVSDTTTGPDRLWVWAASFYASDATCTQPSTYTERAEVSAGVALDVATADQAAAGASGSLTGTFSANGATGAWLGALLPVAIPATGQFFTMF